MILAQTDSQLISIMGSPAFSQWCIFAFVAYSIYEKVTARMERNKAQKREITGTLESRVPVVHAIKQDVESEIEDLDNDIASLRAHMDQKFKELLDAGERRAEHITRRIDDEVRTIRADMDLRTREIDQRINQQAQIVAGHDTALDLTRSTLRDHGGQLTVIQQRLPRPRA